MRYSIFGNTGMKVSALGFGCMRLPMDDGKVKVDECVAMMHRAYEQGVNYFDTGKHYLRQQSESTLGEAIKGMDRDKIHITTKYAIGEPTAADLRQKCEDALKAIGVDQLDFFLFWGIKRKDFEEKLAVKGGPLESFVKLKDEGLTKHVGFSFHSPEPKDMQWLIDTGHFEMVLCQYSLLDQRNAAGMAYARSKGLGVAVMGPVGGGRLGRPSDVFGKVLDPEKRVSTAELALRFVWSNPSVNIALSGMSKMQHVEENIAVANRDIHLTPEEEEKVRRSLEENKKLADLYCTGCGYCQPCPEAINIPYTFECYIYHKVYDLPQAARDRYDRLVKGKGMHKKSKAAPACVECGECEEKCPQNIPIIKQLQEAHRLLTEDPPAS